MTLPPRIRIDPVIGPTLAYRVAEAFGRHGVQVYESDFDEFAPLTEALSALHGYSDELNAPDKPSTDAVTRIRRDALNLLAGLEGLPDPRAHDIGRRTTRHVLAGSFLHPPHPDGAPKARGVDITLCESIAVVRNLIAHCDQALASAANVPKRGAKPNLPYLRFRKIVGEVFQERTGKVGLMQDDEPNGPFVQLLAELEQLLPAEIRPRGANTGQRARRTANSEKARK